MTEDKILAEVQALHDMIRANYRVDRYCVLINTKGADKGRMASLQILLGQLFPHTKEGRELRLDTLVAVLPLLQPNGKPIDFDSTSRLWLAELLALLQWVGDGDGLQVLEVIKTDPLGWSVRLRELFGYITRPISKEVGNATEEPEMAHWAPGMAHKRKPLQGTLPF